MEVPCSVVLRASGVRCASGVLRRDAPRRALQGCHDAETGASHPTYFASILQMHRASYR